MAKPYRPYGETLRLPDGRRAHNITYYPEREDRPSLEVAEQRLYDGEPIAPMLPAQYVVNNFMQGRRRYIGVRNSLLEACLLYDRALFYLWGRMERPRVASFFRWKPGDAIPELTLDDKRDLWRVRHGLNEDLRKSYFSKHFAEPPAELLEFTTYGEQPVSLYIPDTLPPRTKRGITRETMKVREAEKILKDAGYVRPVSLWRAPDGMKFINTAQALAYLEKSTSGAGANAGTSSTSSP